FAIGAHYVEKASWGEARKRLSAAMGSIDKNATLDVQIQAHTLLGRVLAKIDTPASAAAEYGKVRDLWKNPRTVVEKIQESGDDPRLAKAIIALGEARFFFAEEKRKIAEALRLPAYTGSGRREDIAEFIAKKLAPAMTARVKAILDAESAYQEVAKILPE